MNSNHCLIMNTEFKQTMLEVAPIFNETYETVRKFLVSKEEPEVDDAVHWLDKVIRYNVPHGKKSRALVLVSAYKHFAPKHELSEKSIELSCIVAWSMELLQAFFLVADDIMDHSLTRRGQKCWYLQENVGMTAINDALMLQQSVYEVLRHFVSSHPCYVHIIDLYHSICYKTGLGQCIDCLTTPDGAKTDFALLNQTRYATLIKYKTAYYTFDLPVRVAMYLAGIKDANIHSEATEILLRMGQLFQIQDDIIDCFGDPEVTGKIGTDIEDGKCSWLAVEAVKRMSIDEVKQFQEHYGVKDANSVKIIKSLYEKLNLLQVFTDFEESEYKKIKIKISEFGERHHIDMKPFYGILQLTYKRKK